MYKNILLPVDLGHKETQRQACQTAAAIAASTGASLHVLTVIPDFGTSYVATFFPPDFEKKAMAEAERDLHAFTASVLPDGAKAHHIVGHGTIYREILQHHRQSQARNDHQGLSNADVLRLVRGNPEVLSLLEPLLTDEQVAMVMGQTRGGDRG